MVTSVPYISLVFPNRWTTTMKLNYPLNQPIVERMTGKWRKYGVGIDCHKDMVWVCVLDLKQA